MSNYLSNMRKYIANANSIVEYQNRTGMQVVTSDISPTGRCNRRCPECVVKDRDSAASDLPREVVERYILDLASIGLRGVLFTGGGEPTLWPHLNAVIETCRNNGVKVGIITNGAKLKDVDVDKLSWIRLSYHGDTKIELPKDGIPKHVTLGVTAVVTSDRPAECGKILELARNTNATYVRLVADGFAEPAERRALEDEMMKLQDKYDPYIVVDRKNVRYPQTEVCHRAFFRPSLSEVNGGTVYACSCAAYNSEGPRKFGDKFAICKPEDVKEFMTTYPKMNFKPCDDCKLCQCSDAVESLDASEEHAEFL